LDNAEDGLTFEDVAVLDLGDVDRADAVVLYTEPYGMAVPGGGRHVEFGYGLGRGKRVVVVGPLENIFHWHPEVKVFPRTEYAIRYLNGK
jgi:nucleoside 2-deoxyribosyltransferase